MNKIETLERTVADLTERLEAVEHVLGLRKPEPEEDRALWDYKANEGHGAMVWRCSKNHHHPTAEDAKACQER